MARRDLYFHCNYWDYHFHSRTFQTSQISLPAEDVHLHTHTNRQSILSIIVPFFVCDYTYIVFSYLGIVCTVLHRSSSWSMCIVNWQTGLCVVRGGGGGGGGYLNSCNTQNLHLPNYPTIHPKYKDKLNNQCK